MKTIEEKIETIKLCADRTDGNCQMLSSVYSCLQDAKKCIENHNHPDKKINSENGVYGKWDWMESANMWIEKAAQYLWGFNRPKVWD